MKKSIYLLIALFITFTSNAKPKQGSITGLVVDDNKKHIIGATVSLLKASDSSVIKIKLTDSKGEYEFVGVANGEYFVKVTAVGHQTIYSPTFKVIDGTASVPDLTLVAMAKNMNEVTVVSRKPLVEQKLDRTIVNVEAAISNAGATALEVLEKSPGVSVDKDGNISLKGKQGVQVFIDGKPSYLSGTDLANLLKNMNSSQLDQIEIMTNPPAKYDAAGNSGIINLKTKKNKLGGFNGSVTAGYGQGRFPKNNESINFNYRNSKINLFTNLSYNYRKGFQQLDIQRRFLDKQTKELQSNFEQESYMKNKNRSFNGKIGLDYYASKKTTLGVVVSGFDNKATFGNTSDVSIFNQSNVLTNKTYADAVNEARWKNFSTNFNIRHVFDSTGRELTFDADYLKYDNTNAQSLINAYFSANGAPSAIPDTLLGDLPQNIKIYSFKTDYVHPLKKGFKLEAGLKTSFVKTDNNAIYDSLLNNRRVRDLGRSNHFIYEENINAAYVNLSGPISKKWSGQIGLRVENTIAKGNQLTTGETFKRNYTQLFPTAFVQYTLNEKNSFVLNYGRRINRPDYEDLNPFILFLDRYTFQQGNPRLQPEFTNNVELSHTFKGFLTTTLNYSETNDIISDVLEQNNLRNETFVKKSNIASRKQYGMSVSAGFPIVKWWNTNIWINVYNNRFKGIINGDYVSLGATSGQINISNQFRFKNGWSAELSGYGQTPAVEGVFKIKSFATMNLGISKQILKGKGTIRVNVRDVLWSQKINGESKFSNIDVNFQQFQDSRVFNIGFTYRFSKGKMNGNGNGNRKRGGASEEQSRVKAGNDGK